MGPGLDTWRGAVVCLAVVCALAAGCGEQEATRIAGTPEPDHAEEVARDPSFKPARLAVQAVMGGHYRVAKDRPG